MSITTRIKRKIYNLFHPVVGEIWMFHRVVSHRSNDTNQASLEVTTDHLESLINDYQNRGYNFISLDDMLNEIQSCGILKKKNVCITFDDGYRDNFELAYPILKRLNIPFTIYVTIDIVNDRKEMWWYPGQKLGISSAQLIELASEPLCTLGAHTISHPNLSTLDQNRQFSEISESKTELEKLIGKEVRHFSYPFGAHNSISIECVQKAGYISAVQSWGNTSRQGDRLFELHRREIK